MGLCNSSMTAEEREEARRNKELERQNRADWEEETRKVKLLLLGAGESGKSTIFKQMKVLYGQPPNEKERAAFASSVYVNVIASMRTLCEQTMELGTRGQVVANESLELLLGMDDNTVINGEIAEHVAALWADPGIQETWNQRSQFQIVDSVAYFFDKVAEIGADDYVPSQDDLFRVRVRTSGIICDKFLIDDVEFVLYDVGGQRNERKKWIHCFDAVTAVIFVMGLSEYDQTLFEDSTTNRVDEATTLFGEICNTSYFTDSSMILFLNKKDLFEQKIKTTPIRDDATDRFTDYQGGLCTCQGLCPPTDNPCTCGAQQEAVDYISFRFLSKNTTGKEIYVHTTCATDTENVQVVFEACKDTILKSNLRGAGFL